MVLDELDRIRISLGEEPTEKHPLIEVLEFIEWCKEMKEEDKVTRGDLHIRYYGRDNEGVKAKMHLVIRETYLTLINDYCIVWGPIKHGRRTYWRVAETREEVLEVVRMFAKHADSTLINVTGDEKHPNVLPNLMIRLSMDQGGMYEMLKCYSHIGEIPKLSLPPGPQSLESFISYCPRCGTKAYIQSLAGGAEDIQPLGDLPGPVASIPERLAGDEPVASVFEHPADVGPPATKLDMSDYSARLWRALRREGCTTNLGLLGLDLREFSSRKNVGAVTMGELVAAQEYLRSSMEQ